MSIPNEYEEMMDGKRRISIDEIRNEKNVMNRAKLVLQHLDELYFALKDAEKTETGYYVGHFFVDGNGDNHASVAAMTNAAQSEISNEFGITEW